MRLVVFKRLIGLALATLVCDRSANWIEQRPSRAEFRDSGGLCGGTNVWVSSRGIAYCQVLRIPLKGESGIQEKRYKLDLAPGDFEGLAKALQDAHVSSLEIDHRVGVPDESAQVLHLEYGSGPGLTIWRWAGQREPRFDAIRDWFQREGGTIVKRGTLIYEGPCESHGRPTD